MKKILVQFLLFFSVCANAQIDKEPEQSDSIEIKIVNLPDSTAIGAPHGKKISREIGPSGGTIISDDGKVKLIFPANALAQPTAISIQPVENIIPNGNKAYQFEPSGIQFKKPVQLIFYYSDEEAAICPPELKFMALQNHKGKWEYMGYTEWDSTSKSLKGSISHFSAFVDGNEFELTDTEITIKTGKTHQFSLNRVQKPSPPNEPGEDELPPLPVTMQRGNREALWKVNGQTGGNQKHGTISPVRGQAIKAKYTAPAFLTPDPITVKLELNDIHTKWITSRWGKRGKIIEKVTTGKSNVASFSCKVNLYDEYKISVIYNKSTLPSITDSASFIATVYPHKVDITEPLNYSPAAKIDDPYACKTKMIIDKSCIGIIDIAAGDVRRYTMSKDYPPEILFEFREKQNLCYKFQYICKAAGISTTTPVTDQVVPSEPHEINFIANGQRQTINYFPNPVTIIVNPVRRE